jgi:hypothetical protein
MITVYRWTLDHRARFALMVILLIAAVVLAECDGTDGMYQGGGDREPGWR